jgi:hypothetical protein
MRPTLSNSQKSNSARCGPFFTSHPIVRRLRALPSGPLRSPRCCPQFLRVVARLCRSGVHGSPLQTPGNYPGEPCAN